MGKAKVIEINTPEERTQFLLTALPSLEDKVIKMKTVFYQGHLAQIGGTYRKALETIDFIYFVDWKEGDENAAVWMFRKDDLSLASNNYFAFNSFIEDLGNKDEIVWISRNAKQIPVEE